MTQEAIFEALKQIQDPDLHRDIVTLGFVKRIETSGNRAEVTIELTTPACPVKDQMKAQAEDLIRGLGFSDIHVEMTARVRTAEKAPEDLIPGVKHCIAVASGKGGVGKSTVSVNLAVALAQTGAKVGLMDADVYGPSIPMMMGCEGEQPLTANSKILPIQRFGIKVMSLGFLLEPGQAPLWRGPMVAGTVKQLLADVNWDELDYLLVDLPPGTGDAPMSLAQLVPLTGVVLVATPDQVAANIAAKSIFLFRRLNTQVMGVIENMSGFLCPECGTVSRIFAGKTGEALAAEYGIPYLGSVPLNPNVSQSTEEGAPVMITRPESLEAQTFREIAGRLAQQASIAGFAKAGA
jgi:ATP-binding protein involved in chromosome partitioning